MAITYSRGNGGTCHAFVGDYKVIWFPGDLWVVARCVNQTPVARIGAYDTEAEALAAIS